jgi:hypothetical protein
MKWKLFAFALMITFLSTCPVLHAEEVSLDGVIACEHVRRSIKTLLYQEKYETLEKTAADWRQTKARFSNGIWKLRWFFAAFDSPTEKTEEGWKYLFEKLNRWMALYPNSVTARVAAATAWSSYACVGRGDGYASTVSERRWQLYKERLEKAYELASIAPAKPSDDCPHRYDILLSIALGQSVDDSEYEKIFKKAIAFEPGYYDYYSAKAMRLLPRWHGKEGEWKKFAEEAVKLTPKSEGSAIYTRIIYGYWDMEELGPTFETAGVSWDKMKKGFLDMEKIYPDSFTVLNNFYKYACKAGDKETMKRLYNKIGDNWYNNIWMKKENNYDKCMEMAGIKGKSWKQVYENGDSLERKQIFRMAKEGDPKSQYSLGIAYRQGGKVFSQDYGKAFEWLQKSANQDYPAAQSMLGVMYSNGEGVTRDMKKAAALYKLAAEQGNCSSANSLAFSYKVGKNYGIEPDKIQEYAWSAQCNNNTKKLQEGMSDTELQKAKEEADKIKKRIASKPKIFDPSWEGPGHLNM